MLGFHPFGSQATGGEPLALSFASRPCDRFAFVEDEEAAGLISATPRLIGKVHHYSFRLISTLHRGGLSAFPTFRLTHTRLASTVKPSLDSRNVKSRSLINIS
jgi:hypothetical protein